MSFYSCPGPQSWRACFRENMSDLNLDVPVSWHSGMVAVLRRVGTVAMLEDKIGLGTGVVQAIRGGIGSGGGAFGQWLRGQLVSWRRHRVGGDGNRAISGLRNDDRGCLGLCLWARRVLTVRTHDLAHPSGDCRSIPSLAAKLWADGQEVGLIKDRIYLLLSGLVCAASAWAFWWSFGGSASDLLTTITMLALFWESRQLDRRLNAARLQKRGGAVEPIGVKPVSERPADPGSGR